MKEPAVTFRIFAAHPVAAVQYAQLLCAEKDLRVATDGGSIQVGIFDRESSHFEAAMGLGRLKWPAMRALFLSPACDENHCLQWLFRGIWGVVAFDRYQEELPRAVRAVADGRLWFPAPVVRQWMRTESGRRAAAISPFLTKRECEIAEFLLRRLSNKEIAGMLNISDRTVKFHVTNILAKLQLRSRVELNSADLLGSPVGG